MEDHQTKEQSKLQKLIKGGKKPVAAAMLAGCLAVAGLGAYFTGTDTVENKFSVSEGLDNKIEVVEPNWDPTDDDENGIPDAAEDLVPNQTVAKDPKVQNKSDVEAWLFAQVKVPAAEVSVIGEDGAPGEAAMQELFTYTVNEGWTEVGTGVTADGYTTHTYKYANKVAGGAETGTIFDTVTLINLAEAQGTSGAQQIDVTGFGIQAEGLATADDALAAYNAQNA